MTDTHPALLAETLAVAIESAAFDDAQVLAGTPRSGWLPLGTIDGVDVGVWEMTPGEVTDTEAEEIFCILSGAGRLEFLDPPAAPLTLRPGTLVRLQDGWRTRWSVTETLRKIAVVPREDR